jgi:hypothetical protein
MMSIQMRLHMNHICESIIRIDQQIKFVCIVDENAKLLIGQDRSIPSKINSIKSSETTDDSSHLTETKVEDLVEIQFKYRNIHLFYSEYLLWVIKSCTGHLDDTKNKGNFGITQITNKFKTSTFFELSGIDGNSVKLVVTPIDNKMKTFLCIYFEPSYIFKSSGTNECNRFKSLLRKINVIISLNSKMLDLV